jgi:hypothetical protein
VHPTGFSFITDFTTIADSRVVVFENSGHYPFLEERERFLKTLAQFYPLLSTSYPLGHCKTTLPVGLEALAVIPGNKSGCYQ